RLCPEAVHFRRRSELPGHDQLQGNDPVQAALARLVDDTHATATNFLQKLVVAQAAAPDRTGRFLNGLGWRPSRRGGGGSRGAIQPVGVKGWEALPVFLGAGHLASATAEL